MRLPSIKGLRPERAEAHAVRIRGFAKSNGWRVGPNDISRALKIDAGHICMIMAAKGWDKPTLTDHYENRLGREADETVLRPVDEEFS